MSRFTKYRLYQKYETRGSQEAIPVYPNTFSIDGDGTMPVVIVEENSRDCGYTGDTQPMYRWYNMPIDKYYVCDACQDYENQYLTLVAKGSGAFKKVDHSGAFQYSKDGGSTWSNATSATTISVNNGDRVMLKGTLAPNMSYGVGRFSASTTFETEGNPMSLLFGDNFIGQTSLSGKNYACRNMFSGCTSLASIEKLSLPATTLSTNCYESMFRNCTSLTSVPSNLLQATTLAPMCYEQMFLNCTSLATTPNLPATTLAGSCYADMFNGCTSLTTAPVLSATTLAYGCYTAMFCNCTSLRTAPDLLATTLTESCYYYMFMNCSNLNYVKCLATNISAEYCTRNWLANVSSSGTFVKASSMSSWTSGSGGIPSNWAVQNA